jgi:hypothetical protein
MNSEELLFLIENLIDIKIAMYMDKEYADYRSYKKRVVEDLQPLRIKILNLLK